MECLRSVVSACSGTALPLCLSCVAATFIGICVLVRPSTPPTGNSPLTRTPQLYVFVWLAAPIPHPPSSSEKCFVHVEADGHTSPARQLRCWQERHDADKEALKINSEEPSKAEIEAPEVFLSVIVPAYNEQDRLGLMLADAVGYLESAYPLAAAAAPPITSLPPRANSTRKLQPNGALRSRSNSRSRPPGGWEILLVSDGSTDGTVATALAFAASLPAASPARGAIRVVTLGRNRGKGGAVLHGLRHARGAYAVFADADGATRFRDVARLVAAARAGEDARGRAVAVGSRAHLQQKREKREWAKKRLAAANGRGTGDAGRRRSSSGASGAGGSDAVVERSWFRTFLMRSFHVFLWLLTPRATGRVRDTQCGFKLFSRAALRDIVPYMHCEGWIFDVEMLMLAEAAGIGVAEVPVTWREVTGSKLNVVRDSLGMAYGLGMLRLAWALGVYKRD